MGEQELARYPSLVREADEILGYSISELCLQDPDGRLARTEYTQVALFVVNALQYLTWFQEGNEAQYFAGHSLGEYNALVAAGVLDFGTGLKLVKWRGESMSQVDGGGMTAVLGLSATDVERVLREHGADEVDIANLNTQQQTVIAGPHAALDAAEAAFEGTSGRTVRLNVSGPFHSRYMQPAAHRFATEVGAVRFGELTATVVSNVHAAPYCQEEIADNLVAQITSPVRWVDTVEYLTAHGLAAIVQIGPGAIVGDMVRQIQRLAVKAT
jgi:trans-AT polyketide synthase/acyltransferase/oxidoreductase domain-containing protein